jgi:glycosyltransferase involved in cell wall biosynthesis
VRIAIDARELEGRRTGVGRYLHELLRAWATAPASRVHDFVLCSTSPVDLAPYQGLRVHSVATSGHGVLWEQVSLPRLMRSERADLLFAPGYTAPLRSPAPTILVIHDVSFASHPEWFSWREGARRRTVTRLAARQAAQVVTVSQFSKSEIEAHLGVDPGRITVIANGVTPMTRHAGNIPRRPLVLYVGSIFNRRHVTTLIDAVSLLAKRGLDVELEIVGDNRTSPRIDLEEYVARAALSALVRIRSYVADAELAECYARASVFAFLSEYEGFGLTPLEALTAGVPIVVLDNATTREVFRDGATFVATPTAAAIADGLARSLYDLNERQRVLAAAPHTIARHSWTAAATKLLALFDRAAASQPPVHAIT